MLRVAWAVLPITAGTAAADASHDWSDGPRAVGAILLWVVWALALLGLFAPRPLAVTIVRVAALWFVVLACVSASATTSEAGVAAIVSTAICLAMASLPPFAIAAAQLGAYGDERRIPLKTPPALWCGPLPIAAGLVGVGVAAGPLLLAGGQIAGGIVAVLAGVPTVWFLGRALDGLARRWAVIVPAGITIVDRMTLAEPHLFPRDHLVHLRLIDAREPRTADTLDLRVGAVFRSVCMEFNEDAEILRARPPRREAKRVLARRLLFAPVSPTAFLTLVEQRRRARSGGDAAA